MTTHTTTSLTAFLLARIEEDEAAANYANNGGRWESWNRSWDTEPERDITANGVRLFTVPTMYDEHIARHDPARVLAEVKAHRAIVERCGREVRQQELNTRRADFDTSERLVLRILASIYSAHPDYDESWRP